MFLLCPSVSRTRVRVMCMKTNPEGNNAFKALSQYLLSYQTHTETWNKNWFLISSFFPSVHIQKPESCTFLHWWHPGWSSSPLFIQECLLIFLWCLMPSEWAPKPENTHTHAHKKMRRWTDTSNKAFVCCLTAIPLSFPLSSSSSSSHYPPHFSLSFQNTCSTPSFPRCLPHTRHKCIEGFIPNWAAWLNAG